MKRNFLLLIILISINQPLVAQRYTLDTVVKDINHDKVVDTLINEFSSGSAFGGRTITIINGKTKEKFELSNYHGYSSLTRSIIIPENLTLKSNRFFLDVFKEKLLPPKKGRMEASLGWLLSAELNRKQLESDSLFKYIAKPKTNWEPRINIPEPYYIEVSGDTLKKLQPEERSISKNTQGFLVYYTYGYNIERLDTLVPVAENKDYKVYKTDHAVFVNKGNAYRWVFISDAGVTGAPDRHSWVSIETIKLVGKYLIIHQDVPPDTVYNIQIVNIETQKVAALDFSPAYNNWTEEGGMETFEIIDDQLIFTEYGKPEIVKLPLKKLFDSFEQLK